MQWVKLEPGWNACERQSDLLWLAGLFARVGCQRSVTGDLDDDELVRFAVRTAYLLHRRWLVDRLADHRNRRIPLTTGPRLSTPRTMAPLFVTSHRLMRCSAFIYWAFEAFTHMNDYCNALTVDVCMAVTQAAGPERHLPMCPVETYRGQSILYSN